MDIDSRVRTLEIAHARTETKLDAISGDITAIRQRMDAFAETLEKTGAANTRFATILVICAAVAGAALPVIIQRVLQ